MTKQDIVMLYAYNRWATGRTLDAVEGWIQHRYESVLSGARGGEVARAAFAA